VPGDKASNIEIQAKRDYQKPRELSAKIHWQIIVDRDFEKVIEGFR